MRSVHRFGIRFFLIAVAAFGLFSHAHADTINLGSDYLQTVSPGTFFNFGASIGTIQFTGDSIGPGNTDTIVY